jgi:hypothetical protein
MAKKKVPGRSTSASAARPTFGWVKQPPPPTIEEIVQKGVYAEFGATRELLEAQERLHDYMDSSETIERAAFERRRPGMVGPESLVGSYIGRRYEQRKGRFTEEMCVVGTVEVKVDKQQVCDSCRLDSLADKVGAPIDVVPVGRPRTMDWTIELPPGLVLAENPPIRCGTTIGPYDGTAPTGTFGALVLGNDNRRYILSNNHVLAGVSGVWDGIGVGLPVGTEIRHPGKADQGSGPDIRIGALSKASELRLSQSQGNAPDNTLDAALAEADPPSATQQFFHYFGAIAQQPMQTIPRNATVQKIGRTTERTVGEILGVAGRTPPIGYVMGRDLWNRSILAYGCFLDVLVIRSVDGKKFSDRGDSGSIILADESPRPRAVGLLFAGGTDQQTGIEVTYAIPMARVFDKLGIARFINDQ